MNRPKALLHVVGSEQVGDTGKLVKKVVLETEHRGRSHDSGLGVNGTNDFLTPALVMSQYLCNWKHTPGTSPPW